MEFYYKNICTLINEISACDFISLLQKEGEYNISWDPLGVHAVPAVCLTTSQGRSQSGQTPQRAGQEQDSGHSLRWRRH